MLCEVPIQTDVVGGQVEMMIQYIRRPRLLMQSVPTNCLELSLILAILFAEFTAIIALALPSLLCAPMYMDWYMYIGTTCQVLLWIDLLSKWT